MKKMKPPRLLAALGLLLVLVAVPLAFSYGVDALEQSRSEEAVRRLTQAIQRDCLTCYATEGSYPQSLDYLKEHYGLQIDESRYAVFYTPTASNLMPQITVLECQP